MKVQINETETQTIIEVRLNKQQTQTIWPQLYSRHSVPITPEQKNSNIDMIDQQIHSSTHQQQSYELSIKNVLFEFAETMDNKAVVDILIKQVRDCQVQFTDTNFTATFYSKFEDFYQLNSFFYSLIFSQ